MSQPSLGPAEIDFYWENGYVLVPGLLSPDKIERWGRRFTQVVSGEADPAEHMTVMRDVMVAKGAVEPDNPAAAIAKVQDFERDPVLSTYINDPDLLDCVETLIGPELLSIHTMLINKPPGVDGRHPLHQDLLYFPFRPADKIVASWTSIDRATKENGCLQVVPGTHRGELLAHENPDWEYLNLAYFGAKGFDAESQRVHLEMEPGDTVFFHPILIHGSGRNRTEGFRRSISAHYASQECESMNGNALFGVRHYRPVVRQGEE